MSLNNQYTQGNPSFSLAEMCLSQINGSASSSSQFCNKLKIANSKSKYKDRKGERIGIKNVALIERMGQSKIGDIFHKVKFDCVKAYVLIDIHKKRMKVSRPK